MPLFAQRTHAHSIDGFGALATDGASGRMVVLLAVGESLDLKELSILESDAACLALEVLAMPVFAQRGDC